MSTQSFGVDSSESNVTSVWPTSWVVYVSSLKLEFLLLLLLLLNVSRGHRFILQNKNHSRKYIWITVSKQKYELVRKHLTGGFQCAVLNLSGILWPLLTPEHSGIKRRGMPFPGLRNPGMSFFFNMVIITLFLFMNHMAKVIVYDSLSLIRIDLCFVSLEF